ncbi:MAG: ABC transporter substrate-binding protein [Clostridia bacterium]|nr:ABC transporter substrate-binding protein [Clostridia bacterium]
MKSQKLIKVLALVLVIAFAGAALAACDGGKKPGPAPSGQTNNGGNAPSYTTPLVVAYDQFSQKFSPFFADTSYDQDVAGMTQLGAMTTTRTSAIVYNGIEGEKETYNGTEYEYQGIADLKVEQTGSAATNNLQTVYTIKLRDDIKFSDGQPATIDDIIFYYYVVVDPYYVGNSTLGTIDIVGLQEYMYNNSNIGTFDVEAYVADIANKPALQQYVMDKIITPGLTSEMEWVKVDVKPDPSYAGYVGLDEATFNAAPAHQIFYLLYGLDASYDPTAHTEAEVLAKTIEEYGFGAGAMTTASGNGHYLAYGENYGASFHAQVVNQAKILGGKEITGNPVPNIAGIKKIDDYTVQVTANGYEANAIYQICSATLTPKHYYGDASLYNYENNQFGFEARTEEGMNRIITKNNVPMGAGPYKFVKYEDQVVYFEANPYYYKGEPYIKNIQFKETPTKDKIAAIATGEVDVAGDVSGTVDIFKEIGGYNTDTGSETGSKITSSLVWNLGYGYIGIQADRVRVGNDSGSDQSKALRKAIATLLSVHRESVIATYYGSAAAVIEYPISSTSWAAPQISDQGYQTAFSVDANGQPIYTSDMTADQKQAAAIAAAKGFLEKAGYTFDAAQNKFVSAPLGASMTYEVWIPAEGVGDHPAWNVANFAAADLLTLGLTLNCKDITQSTDLWDGLAAGTVDMWAAAWGSTIDPDMHQVYHSSSISGSGSNHYHIADPNLDQLIMSGRQSDDQAFRKATYKSCLDIIMDWAVEVPTYQRKNLVCFSTERIKIDSITPDITTYWGWMSELETLELNAE